MERELRPLVRASARKWKLEVAAGDVTVYSSERAVVAFAGMGVRRAMLAATAALSLGPVERIISAGWAGGLTPAMRSGMVPRVRAVIDEASGELFDLTASGDENGPLNGAIGATLVTVDRVVSSEDKRRLREKYSADLVDMEAAAVARIAKIRGIPFLAVKGVSDEHDFDLPDIERFVTPAGQFRQSAFAVYSALRPGLWKPVARMARGSSSAARNLCAALDKAMDWNEIRGKE